MTSRRFGPLIKAKETLAVFARNAPSPRTLWANRVQRFDRVHPILPSTAVPGKPLRLTLQVWDQCERLHRGYEGTLEVASTDPNGSHPPTVQVTQDDGGLIRVEGITFESTGVQYLTFIEPTSGDRFVSNPVRVSEELPYRVYWGDIHLHSSLSDGTGTADRGYEFGRDVMALDVVAYTDHDTMGFFIPPGWQRKRMHRAYFQELCQLADAYNEDGSFVTLPAYEWTKQPNRGGHINVYFENAEDAKLFDSHAEESWTYERLWNRLREWDREHDSRVVTVPHHPAEAMYPFDFSSVDYDDVVAPVVEIYSQWGSSEKPADDGNEFPLAMGQGEIDQVGFHVRDAHQLGHRVGVIGSSDFHGPRPGHSLIHTEPHLPSLDEWRSGGLGWGNIWRVWDEPSYPGGLTAFLAPENTRDEIMTALASRSAYATSQPHRILVDFQVNGVDVFEQDDQLAVNGPESPREITVYVAGTEPVASIHLVKNNAVWETVEGTDDPNAEIEAYTHTARFVDEEPIEGMRWSDSKGTSADAYLLVIRQASDRGYHGMAWVGPVWVEGA